MISSHEQRDIRPEKKQQKAKQTPNRNSTEHTHTQTENRIIIILFMNAFCLSVLRWKSRKKNCGGDAHHSRRTREMEEITCAAATTTLRFLSHQAILIDIVKNGAAAPAAVERRMRCYRFNRRLCKRLPHAADEAGNNFYFHFFFVWIKSTFFCGGGDLLTKNSSLFTFLFIPSTSIRITQPKNFVRDSEIRSMHISTKEKHFFFFFRLASAKRAHDKNMY